MTLEHFYIFSTNKVIYFLFQHVQHLQSVMLQNEYFLTNIGFDTAEYEPARMRQEVVKHAGAWSKSDGSALGCISAKKNPRSREHILYFDEICLFVHSNLRKFVGGIVSGQ